MDRCSRTFGLGLRLVVAVGLAACSPTAPTPTPGLSSPGQSPTPSADTAASPFLLPSADPLARVLPDTTIGLEGLSSYRASLTVGFVGTLEGVPSQWTRNVTLAVSRAADARILTIEDFGGVDVAEAPLTVEVGGTRFTVDAHGQCSASPIDPIIRLEEPAADLLPVFQASEPASESIDGRAVDTYTFDQDGLETRSAVQSSGTLSLDHDAGFVVRYELRTMGVDEAVGELGSSSTLTMHYELTDIGAPITIDLPATCPR